MSDPLSIHVLGKGDIIAQSEDSTEFGKVVDVILFKKPIYKVEFPDGHDGGKKILHYRASLTKKGRAGKQFVQVSKEDGGRWSTVAETAVMMRIDAPQTPDAQPGADAGKFPNVNCSCTVKHPDNYTHVEI